MLSFEVRENSPTKLDGLSKMLEWYVNDQWIGDHFTEQQAKEAMLEMFKRQLLIDLDRLELICKKD